MRKSVHAHTCAIIYILLSEQKDSRACAVSARGEKKNSNGKKCAFKKVSRAQTHTHTHAKVNPPPLSPLVYSGEYLITLFRRV